VVSTIEIRNQPVVRTIIHQRSLVSNTQGDHDMVLTVAVPFK
jgi:hypothetical protein